jgi:glycosyltransferase involved in cell wall biosynthesis
LKPDRIKILFLYWGKKGGGARYSLEVAKELSNQKGVDVHLSVSKQCEILGEFDDLSLPTFHIDTYRNVYGFIKKFTIGRFELREQLETYIRENGIQYVIIGMDFFWCPLIYKACKRTGTKAVYVVHEPKPHPNEPVLMALVKRKTLKKAITGASHIVTLTHHVKTYITESYNISNSAISVIPHGIFSYYRAESPKSISDKNTLITLLYFGRIEYYKGLDILLKAYKKAEKLKNNIRLEIWGSGDMSSYADLVDSIQNSHIENRWVDEAEIPEIFKRADICVLPYRDASQSGVVGIASDAALPVIACPASGLKEQLMETGAIFSDDFTPDSLLTAIKTLIEDPKLYKTLSEKSLRYAENLSWANIAHEFKKVCEKL